MLPLVFVLVESLRHHHDHGDSIFAAQITQSGLATPVLMLTFLSNFMLPLAASLVAGDIAANEDGNGTLKTILTRSVDRGQVIAAKALAAFTYASLVVFVSVLVATAAGIASWGFHPVVSLSGTIVSAGEALALVFASNALYLIPMAAVVSIGVLLSVATRNSAAAVVGTLGAVIMLFILSAIPGFEGAKPYLLTAAVRGLAGPAAHTHRLGPDPPLDLGVRALCGALAGGRLPRLPAPRRRRRLAPALAGAGSDAWPLSRPRPAAPPG